ncbi:exopolysaccharide biosynthesis polyprenyl glycosylphosphotransferase [Neotamlana laminarinivorans]|uniref:Exopolysaccharide biosynthesis polyprenyl glycosylphosphotransferase n=1 Tax=Neotamlana laminarinivorans TaxID=2883124 RepID=A0A9X1HY86_9FLAO|nr:exopolysaccharide biosynthesis polyprenyl glycosylphosphotransferase [Tamlana laminarinivorans]MCB4798334.1 exopolysaccharide biosynthesis polyprenyl glycosylphosphotransferase [Tamlana laminarinivorans]
MEYKRGRFSWLLRPILIICDLLIINILAHYILQFNEQDLYFYKLDRINNQQLLFAIYSLLFWLFSASLIKFYEVYRYSSFLKITSLLFKQHVVFLIGVYAFIGFFRSVDIHALVVIKYISFVFLAVGVLKILTYLFLKAFRAYFQGNIRNIVVFGEGKNIEELISIFTNQKELGYNLNAFFSDRNYLNRTGTVKDGLKYLVNNVVVDEIFCAIDELTEKDVNELVKLANINKSNIKFIPKTSELFKKRLRADYYAFLPVFSIQEGPLNNVLNKMLKRVFDVVFSLFVLIFLFSWVSIILFVIIKLDSKGPLFYRHKRNGINYKEFYCYKYRSLKTTQEIRGTYVKKNDERLTKAGKFLRRTNLDELPQFINVFLGDMSVVGPRPHMLTYTDEYSKKVDKYNFIYRHHIKPGITGLAQVSGYRGEIELDSDIINRIKYDNFYIENWSLVLDINIIFQTLFNIIKGEEKAY